MGKGRNKVEKMSVGTTEGKLNRSPEKYQGLDMTYSYILNSPVTSLTKNHVVDVHFQVK